MSGDYASHTDADGFTVESNTATADQLAEQLAPPPPDETPPDAPPAEEPAEPKLTPFRKGTSPSNDSAKRMLQATQQLAEQRRLREAAEKRAAALEARLREQSPPPAPPPPPVAPAPVAGAKFPTYDVWLETHPDGSWDDWQDEKIDWHAEQKLAASARQQEAVKAQAEHAKVLQAHAARMATVSTKYPDFQTVRDQADQALAAAGIHTFPDAVVRAVIQSDRSDDLIYFLGTHPEEAIQLAREAAAAPVAVAPLLQRMLEAQLAASRPAPATGSGAPARSQARPPVNPVGGTATVTATPLEELEFGPEYVRRMNQRDRERGKW